MEEMNEMNEFLALAIAEIFEVPEDMVNIAPNWWMDELTELLGRIDVQARLKDWIKQNKWKEKRNWYGKVEEEG
jgi:hypothetical protein